MLARCSAIDLGGVLYFFGMFGWLTFMTIPFGGHRFPRLAAASPSVLLVRRLRRSEPA